MQMDNQQISSSWFDFLPQIVRDHETSILQQKLVGKVMCVVDEIARPLRRVSVSHQAALVARFIPFLAVKLRL